MNAKSAKNDPSSRALERLRAAGIRATRQRLALAALLFDGTCKHLSAEQIHKSVNKNNIKVSLATVYNCLHQFADLALIKEVTAGKDHTYFDTNIENHYHFYDEDTRALTDIPLAAIELKKLPKPPGHQKITGIDIIIRTKALNRMG